MKTITIIRIYRLTKKIQYVEQSLTSPWKRESHGKRQRQTHNIVDLLNLFDRTDTQGLNLASQTNRYAVFFHSNQKLSVPYLKFIVYNSLLSIERQITANNLSRRFHL